VEPRAPTVLVAEDEPQLLRLLERVLLREGYDVVLARDGEEAVSALESHAGRIGLAVLDAGILPRGSREVLEAIAAGRGGIGVVLTSGGLLEADLQRLLEARDGVFLRKPYTPKALLRVLEQVLERAAP
jgi:CheY-like chemotaxis protein